jgi:hypothetical protein
MAVDYSKVISSYKKQLEKSKTANVPNVTPTGKDIAIDIALRKAQKQQSAASGSAATAQWYGTEKGANTPQSGGISRLGKFLQIMGTPLYGVVGGIESVLGKGTKSGLENVVANVKEEGTMGDLLRSYGMSNIAAFPLGLALDFAFDPVMWGTLGTEALIPRIAAGIGRGVKTGEGALRGAKIAAESGLLNKVESAGRVIPNLTKQAFNVESAGYGKLIPTKYREISKLASEKTGQFEKLMGKSTEDILTKNAQKSNVFATLENKIGNWGPGEKIIKFLGYSPSNKLRGVIEEENLAKLDKLGLPEIDLSRNSAMTDLFENVKPLDADLGAMDDIANNISRVNNSDEHLVAGAKLGLAEERRRKQMLEVFDDVENRIAKGDPELLNKFSEMGANTKDEALYLLKSVRSGLDGYDKKMARIIASPLGRKMLNAYQVGIGLFKNAKIGGSLLATGTNSIVGNTVMTSMMGVDILNNAFWRSMGRAITMMKGGPKAFEILWNKPAWREIIENNPETFFHVFGIDPKVLSGGIGFVQEVATKSAQEAAKISGKSLSAMDSNQLSKAVAQAWTDTLAKTSKEVASLTRAQESGVQGTTMVSEYMIGAYGDFVKKIKKLADNDVTGAKAFYWYLTKPMAAYGKIDQTYKFGLAYHLAEEGISPAEIKTIARRLPIEATDRIKVPNRNLYKLSPRKAMEVANETYMNYAAMPGFVQMMRTLPIVGSPFMSFTYGMMAGAAKTMVYNPEFFNKVQFLLREFSGAKSPLEKQALQDKYYSWLDQPGMVKLPFFQNNPLFLNMSNMIPYYTLNVFQPMERNYTEKFGNAVANIVDKSPFLKTPEGQLMFDYFIQPLILQKSEPKGMFNQQLYPTGASALQKTGYITRQAAESVMPPLLGYAGLVLPQNEKYIPYIPLYRWRQLANAVHGKTAVGASTKTPALEMVGRTSAAMAGWPVYTAKLKYNQ